jgi:hypothetical protein
VTSPVDPLEIGYDAVQHVAGRRWSEVIADVIRADREATARYIDAYARGVAEVTYPSEEARAQGVVIAAGFVAFLEKLATEVRKGVPR